MPRNDAVSRSRAVDRREFLRIVSGAAAGASLAPESLVASARQSSLSARRIVVIGAGLAGLTAAYELARHGHRVTVLEARPWPGGRVFTVRSFDDQLHAEAGGEWINPKELYILHYVREMGLHLTPDQGEDGVWQDGALRPEKEVRKALPGLAELQARIREHAAQVNPYEDPRRSPLARLDGVNYLEWLKSLGGAPATLAYLRIGVNDLMGADIQDISALHMLYEMALPRDRSLVESRIRGGNTRLIDAFVQRLDGRVRTGAAVSAVRHDGRGVRIEYDYKGQKRTEEADHLVLAIPATVLRRLRIQPALPQEIASAYDKLVYGRILKVMLQAKQRFWEKPGANFRLILTHRESNNVYHSSNGQPGPRGLLTCYAAGWGADAWGPLGTKGQIDSARKFVAEIWPEASTLLEAKAVSWFWNRQQWIHGTYAYFAPGEMLRIRPFLSQAVDRIHFAGEHTAVWQGYMNGAVESGLRAAAEIEPAVGVTYRELAERDRAAAGARRAGAERVAAD